MTYRGVYHDGIIILQGEVDLRDGQPVEVSPTRVRRAKSTAQPAAGKTRPGKSKSAKPPLPGFGAWKHRTDIPDTAEFARRLRRRTSTRPTNR